MARAPERAPGCVCGRQSFFRRHQCTRTVTYAFLSSIRQARTRTATSTPASDGHLFRPYPPSYCQSVRTRTLLCRQAQPVALASVSMLSCPNDESAANLDAAKMWRDDREGFKKKVCQHSKQPVDWFTSDSLQVSRIVRASQEAI